MNVGRLDAPIPGAPAWRAVGLAPVRALKIFRDWVTQAEWRDAGPEGTLHDGVERRRPAWEHLAQRGRRETGGAGELRADAEQQRTTVLDVVRDIAQIGERQQASVLEPVQHDEIELLDLHLEQFPHRKGDQRQLVQRREVVLLRRTKYREVYEVDGWIGLQQPPPGALAGMRFARDQQHAQPVAHAVDLHDRPVVDRGNLARKRISLQLEHGRPCARDRHFDDMLAADRKALDPGRIAVAPNRKPGGAGRMRHTEILDRDPQRHGMTDNSVRGSLDDAQAAVDLLSSRRDEHVERHAARRGLGNVVHLAVGDGDDPGEPRARNVGERAVDRREQPRSGVAAFGHGDRAQLQVGQLRRLLLDGAVRRLGEARAVADLHRGGLVDHEETHIRQGFARLLHEARSGEPKQQHREGKTPPDGPARPTPGRGREHQDAQKSEQRDEPYGNQRVEADTRDRLFEMHATGPTSRGWPARAPGRPCSCR